MAITISPITQNFVAEIGDLDLSKPLAAEDVAAVKSAFWKYAVLIFPDQDLTPDQHLAFSLHFGPVETDRVLDTKADPHRLRNEFADLSNLDPTGKIWGAESRLRIFQMGNRLWHTDSSFKYRPALCSLLYSRTIAPIGGHTEFADQRAAYDALPDAMKKKLEGLIAEHAIAISRSRMGFQGFSDEETTRLPAVPQVVVRTIPESGRKSLYLASHAGTIVGMPEAEGRALIDQLIAHVTQRQFVYTHRWRVKDLGRGDTRCTIHRATDYDDLRYVRDMHRTTVRDVANTCEQAGIKIAA